MIGAPISPQSLVRIPLGPKRPDVLDHTPAELAELAVALGQPAFRGAQIARWLYRRFATGVDQMTDLPAGFREQLRKQARIGGAVVQDAVRSPDGDTEKVLLKNRDGASIETVLMRQPAGSGAFRNTLCLSSQVGCAVGCPFCATGQSGWFRNLSAGEIVEQVLYWARVLDQRGERVHNLVYMGMGEPLGNYANVWKSIRILNDHDGFGLGARHMTLSTSGIAPRIERMADEGIQVNLAVSLHAAENSLRDELVPINKRYPLEQLMDACRLYLDRTNRRITFEYVLLRDVNDARPQALQLANLVKGMLCHVNLIPLNPEPSSRYSPPTSESIDAFADVLRYQGLPVTVRRERGQEIAAACGQLYRSSKT